MPRDMEFEQAEAAYSSLGDAQHELDGGDKFKDGWQREEGELYTL